MGRRISLITTASAAWLLASAAPAAAGDNGEGLAGETTDRMITFFSLGVVIFFAAFVTVMSLIQRGRERRKEAAKAASARQRTGW